MSRFLLPLLLAATSAFAAGDARKTPVGREVSAYIADADPLAIPAASGTYLSAAVQGGVMGWASLRLDVWIPSLNGHLTDDAGNSASMGELGLDNTETVVVPRALLAFGPVGLLIDAYEFKTAGDGTLTGTFNFGGVDFTVAENVHTDVDMTNVRGILTVSVFSTDFLRISLLGGISYYGFDVTVTGQTSGTASVSAPVPVPIIGVLAQAKFGHILLEGEISGLTFDYGDYNIDYLDFQVSVGGTFLKVIAVRAGYRLVSISGTIEGFHVDATLDGFFVGGSVNF